MNRNNALLHVNFYPFHDFVGCASKTFTSAPVPCSIHLFSSAPPAPFFRGKKVKENGCELIIDTVYIVHTRS